MSQRIGGWNVTGVSGSNLPVEVHKAPPPANGQHVIYNIGASFSGSPATPVLVQIVDPDVSPNTVLWAGYVAANGPPILFDGGICVPLGHGVAAFVAAAGSMLARINLHGVTR